MKKHNKLSGNFIAMLTLQVSNYVFPFLTIPYLSRIFSVEHYGVILYALAITAYLSLVCDYGFGMSATRAVSLHRDSQIDLARILSSVTCIKFAIFLLLLISASVCVMAMPHYRQHYLIYILTFFGLLYNVFFPTWLFQGLEQMRYITFLNVITRGISVAFIFTFIHHDQDYVWLPLINLFPIILGAAYVQYILLHKLHLRYHCPSWTDIVEQLKQGWHIFLSTLIGSFYVTSNSFMLGLLTHNVTYVAYYANAEKIIVALNSVYSAFFSALFPHAVKLLQEDYKQGISYIKTKLWQSTTVSLAISLVIYFLIPWFVPILFGIKYLPTIYILRILIFVPVVICISNLLVIQTVIPLNRERILPPLYAMSSLLYLVLVYFLVPKLAYVGMAISVLIVELVVVTVTYIYLKKQEIF